MQRPIIGFIISDSYGNKIFGTNPLHQPGTENILPSKSGTVTVNISYPKLLDGTYILSLYLTDVLLGDMSALENVISFEVNTMVNYQREGKASVLGPVSPVVKWEYDYSDKSVIAG